jgi:hypothetical protein
MNFRTEFREQKKFEPGDRVIYVPNHADSIHHEDCEFGIVSSSNSSYVFIKIYKTKYISKHIDEALKLTAHACKRENLKYQYEWQSHSPL